MKKIIYAGVFTVLLSMNGITVLGKDTNGEQATGQTEFIYVADRPPDMEVDKGDGHLSTSPQTGDPIIQTSLELLVITSALLLMLIIYIKKGETYYEKDD